MKSIGYWRPEDALYSQNLFVYILEHPSRVEAKKNWAAFQADPAWKKVKAESETQARLRTTSTVTLWIQQVFRLYSREADGLCKNSLLSVQPINHSSYLKRYI